MGLTATITVVADHDAWIGAAANIVRSASRRAIEARGHFSLVLSGGSTPAALYEHLAHQPAVDQLDWAATSVYFGDERCVPPGDPASNFTMAATTLLDHVPVPPAQVHRLEGERSPAEAARSYVEHLGDQPELDRNADGTPIFDLVLLGLGGNAHTASLFPGLSWRSRGDELVIDEFVEVQGQWRLSMTPRLICAARERVFLVEGEAKAAAVATVLDGDLDPVVAPAQAIVKEALTTWLLDAPAASHLDR